MPIRDVVLTLIVIGALPYCFKRPYIGVLFWSWISFMAPHRLTWGFAHDLPFAQIVAVPTLAGLVFSKDRRPIPMSSVTALLGTFWLFTGVTTLFAWYPNEAWPDLLSISKIFLMTFVTMAVVHDRRELRYLLLVEAFSIGFYGFKGGLWGLATGGGSGLVIGPEGAFIGDNNGLALGLNMTLPILFFLAREESRLWLRKLLHAMFFLTILAVVFTYSRGGALGLGVVLLALILKSRWKIYALTVALIGGFAFLSFVPNRWVNRMDTISNYEEDRSAISRIYAWKLCLRIAEESPFLGGGFRVVGQDELWAKWMPEWYFDIGATATNRAPNAHSIYFHVLAEHGFMGLSLFLALIAATLLTIRRTRRCSRLLPDGEWINNYCYMMQTSIYAFLVNGVTVNMTYFDLFYFLISGTVLLHGLAATAISKRSPKTATVLPSMQPAGLPMPETMESRGLWQGR